MTASPLGALAGEQRIDPQQPAAGHAPRTGPGVGFLILLGLAVASVNGAVLADAVLTLSLKSTAIDPKGATTVLSIVVGVGSLFALVGYPLIGRLSDRTLSRFGRRRPFLVLGAVLLAIGALLTVAASTTALLTAAYVVTTIGAVSALVACAAIVPDQFDPSRRGPASAIIGLGTPIGAVLGLFLAQLVQPDVSAMILLPAAVAVIGTLLLAVALKDRQQARAERPTLRLRELLSTFWVNPVTHPSFGWAWWSRLMIFFGVAAVNAYQAFYLIIVQHVSPLTVGSSIFLAALILTAVSLVFAPIAGKVSDLVGRRKPFVIAAALIFAVGLLLIAHATSYPAFLVAVAVMGVGQGVYFAVDFALVTQVLPDAANPAKDLGIMNLASSLPSSVVPAVAPALLAIAATAASPQNFTALFVAGAVAALIGAAFILPIRRVK